MCDYLIFLSGWKVDDALAMSIVFMGGKNVSTSIIETYSIPVESVLQILVQVTHLDY